VCTHVEGLFFGGGRHWGRARSCLTPRNTRSCPKCYHTKFGRSRGSRPFGRRWYPKNFGDAGVPPSLGWWHTWPARNRLLPHMCYPAKFGHSKSNHTSSIAQTVWA